MVRKVGDVLISEAYRKLNADFHRQRAGYGSESWQHAPWVRSLCAQMHCETVLDYGCGKGALVKEMGIAGYDPAVPEYAERPGPADLVVCFDVMEHVEEAYVPAVLADIAGLAKVAAVFRISNRPAGKCLPDGRNAHITLHDPPWWLEQMKVMGGVIPDVSIVVDNYMDVVWQP